MRILTLLLAVLAGLSLTPARAAVITDPAAVVTLVGGDIIAEAYAPLSDDPALPVGYLGLFGGLVGFDPAFALQLDYGAGDVLIAETNDWSFDGDRVLSFVFDLVGAEADVFGPVLRLSFTLALPVAEPFGAATDVTLDAQVVAEANLPAVPLPGTLPLLAGALAGVAALRRRRAAL